MCILSVPVRMPSVGVRNADSVTASTSCLRESSRFRGCFLEFPAAVDDDSAHLPSQTKADASQKKNRDGSQPRHKSPPDSRRTCARHEGKENADREANQPEAEQVDHQGHPSISKPAKDSGSNYLQAVKYLEESRDRNEGGGNRDYRRFLRLNGFAEVIIYGKGASRFWMPLRLTLISRFHVS
jgi:hypothetical protein